MLTHFYQLLLIQHVTVTFHLHPMFTKTIKQIVPKSNNSIRYPSFIKLLNFEFIIPTHS